MKIDPLDISVVVQGKVNEGATSLCLKSIREYLPKSEIILSTWEGTDVSGLDYDKALLNKDPGGVAFLLKDNHTNNGNRQLFSTQEGIKIASRPYILKLRTDLFLESANFLDYWDKFSKSNPDYFVFKHKVLTSTVYAREKFKINNYLTPFHLSDFWFFGLKEDLEDYFLKTEFLNDIEAGNWQYKYPNKVTNLQFHWRYPPEQYYCVAWAKRHFSKIKFDDLSDWDRVNFELSKKILYNNFIFLGYAQSGVMSMKEGHRSSMYREKDINGLINFEVFQQRYAEFCDSEYAVGCSHEREQFSRTKNATKLKKHLKAFLKPVAWLFEPISILKYFLKTLIDVVKNLNRMN